jgi:hypothetical protein
MVLLVAAVFAAFVGQTVDATIIVLIVLLGNAINFWQTYRSQRAIKRLRETVTSTASVLRDGNWKEIPSRDVVPGDLVQVFCWRPRPSRCKTAEIERPLCPGSNPDWGISSDGKGNRSRSIGNRSARCAAHGFSWHLSCQRISARRSDRDRPEYCLRRHCSALGSASGRERI